MAAASSPNVPKTRVVLKHHLSTTVKETIPDRDVEEIVEKLMEKKENADLFVLLGNRNLLIKKILRISESQHKKRFVF